MAFLSSTLAAPIVLAMASTCPATQSPNVTVTPTSEQHVVDNTKTTAQLANFDISTVSPYSHSAETQVNGLMRGKVEILTNVSVSWKTNQRTGESCFWYNKVDVNLKLAPTVYVAKKYRPSSCMYHEVYKHELKHVNVDRELSNKYASIFKQKIERFIRGQSQKGPLPAYNAENIKDQMVAELELEITKINNVMQQERIKRQARIDNVHEYNRVADACKGRR